MPSAAPTIVQPTIGGEVAQAVGQIPEEQNKLALQQAEIDAQNIDSSSKRLAVLTKLISSNQGLATSPQMIGATQRAFKGLGIAAPMKNVNGVQSLDTDALFSFGPASEFISQNLGLMLSFQPDQRANLVQAMTGQALPDGISQRLSALPQRMISTPSELSGLYNRATQAIDNLRYPGATVEGAISIIKPINTVLQQNGMPGIDLSDLEGAGLYQSLMNQANLQGLQGKAAKEYADTELAKVRTSLLPEQVAAQKESADARMVSAQASQSRASTYASMAPAVIAKDYADADKAEADTKKVIQEVTSGGASVKDLLANANNNQALVARLESYLNDPTQGINTQITSYKAAHPGVTVESDPQLKALNDEAFATQQRIKAANTAATQAQAAYQSAQARLRKGATSPSAPTHEPPKDMRPNTAEYYQSLSPEAKKQYLDNPNVPADVRAYLKTLPE